MSFSGLLTVNVLLLLITAHFNLKMVTFKYNNDDTNQYDFKRFIMPTFEPKIYEKNNYRNAGSTNIKNPMRNLIDANYNKTC